MIARVILLLCLALVPSRTVAATCAGDCSGDAAVSVNELIVLVNVALGTAAVATCASGDGDGDGAIAVNEIVVAVNAGLNGCPADPDALPAAVLSLVRGMAQLPALADGLSVAIDAIGGSEACELGGALISTCEESGGGAVRVVADADVCRVQTVEGAHRYVGPTRLISDGQCPDVIDAATLRFEFDWRFVAESADGGDAVVAEHALDARLGPLLFGDPPCSIKGGGAIATGPTVYALADGRRFTVGLRDTSVAVEFFDFVGSCDPSRLVTDVDGPVEVGAGIPVDTAAAVADVQLEVDLQARTLKVGGTLDLAALGGEVNISSPEVLGFPLGAGCFSAGVLRIAHGGGVTLLRFPGDGSVAIDRDGDGVVESTDSGCL